MNHRVPPGLLWAGWALVFAWLLFNADAWGGLVWEKARHPDLYFGEHFGDQDSEQYHAWIEKGPDHARAPYRYRILAPWLASILPGTPWQGLMLISWSGLGLMLFFGINTSHSLGYRWESVFSAQLATISWSFLYLFLNPFLTDSLALACVAGALWATQKRNFPIFLVSIVLGVLTREVVLPFAFLWLFHGEKRKTGIAMLAAVSAFLLPRLLLPTDPLDPGMWAVIQNAWQIIPLSWRIKEIYAVLGPWWWFLPLAWKSISHQERKLTGLFLVIMLLTSGFASLVATDSGRMFSLILPGFLILMPNLIGRTIQLWPIWLILACGRAISLWSALHPNPRGFGLHPWLDIALATCALVFVIGYWTKIKPQIQA